MSYKWKEEGGVIPARRTACRCQEKSCTLKTSPRPLLLGSVMERTIVEQVVTFRQFHQRFTGAFFVQNFGAKSYKAKHY